MEMADFYLTNREAMMRVIVEYNLDRPNSAIQASFERTLKRIREYIH